MPSLYQITSVTLSCDEDDDDGIEFGNKSHGNVTSKPVAVCTSDNGPEKTIKRGNISLKKCLLFISCLFIGFCPFFLNKFVCMQRMPIYYPSSSS